MSSNPTLASNPSSRTYCLQEGDLFYDSMVVWGVESRARHFWAPVGALTLELLLLLAVAVISLFHADGLPKRKTLTILYAPPAAAASNVKRLSAPTTFRNAPTRVLIPSPVHKTREALSPPLDTAGSLVGGVPGGVVGGIPDGVLNGLFRRTDNAPVLPKNPAPAPKRISVPAMMAKANLVYDVAPIYPPEAGRARIEGTVVLLAIIAKDGTVQDIRVERGLPVLAQAAIEAVKQWRYRPYLLNGKPIEVDSLITIEFTLSKG